MSYHNLSLQQIAILRKLVEIGRVTRWDLGRAMDLPVRHLRDSMRRLIQRGLVSAVYEGGNCLYVITREGTDILIGNSTPD